MPRPKRKSVKLDAFHQQVAKLKEKRKSMGNVNRVNVVVSDLYVLFQLLTVQRTPALL